jgi:hypothetical protein
MKSEGRSRRYEVYHVANRPKYRLLISKRTNKNMSVHTNMGTNFSYLNCRNIVEKGRKFSLKIFFCQNFVYFYLISFLHPFSICIGRIFSPAGKFSAGTGLKTLVGVGITRGVTEGGVASSCRWHYLANFPASQLWKISFPSFLSMYSLILKVDFLSNNSIMSKAKKI